MKRWFIISLLLIVVPVVVILLKIFYLDYDLIDVLPDYGYNLTLEITTNNRKTRTINISTFAPVNNARQQVYQEESVSDSFKFKVNRVNDNKQIQWKGENISGFNKIKYSSRIKSYSTRYTFTRETVPDEIYPESVKKYLKGTDLIQTGSDLIKLSADKLLKNKNNLYNRIRSIHNFIVKKIKYINFSGGLDAESTLKLMEGSCNGKSRLYAAMVRQIGIPARVVGGIILNRSPKKVIHQWVEIYINGQWVPFGPTNNYFAELPAHYITLYYGDKVLFKHTSKIFFDYSFSFDKITIPKPGINLKFRDLPINMFALMDNFQRFNISLNILIYLLMLPLGALISVILRNIIGFETFGIFLPILVASVLKGTGLVLGLTTFCLIIFLVCVINYSATKLGLLYHPKMAILLSAVILSIVAVFLAGIYFRDYDLINIVFFPVAIIAITVNRVMVVLEEDGIKRLMFITVNTMVVISICYYFMNSTFLQLSMLSFPEIILIITGINIFIGRWAGLRFSEFIRFYRLVESDDTG